jgi:hypothetical protein
MKRFFLTLLLSAVLATSTSVPASADSFVSPFVGTLFGNNSGNGRASFGVNVGWMGAGVVGMEGERGYAPDFFGDQGAFGSNSVLDVLGNLIVGIPVGGTRGRGVRPYATIGGGLLRSTLDGLGTTSGSISDNTPGMNADVGVMGYLSQHVGIRGDVRYFRNLNDNSTINNLNVDFGAFHFWRASVGIVLRP